MIRPPPAPQPPRAALRAYSHLADRGRFVDPRATTYARYTAPQARQEAHVERLFDRIESTGYDASLPPPATRLLASIVSPLRYPFHGLQMLAAQIGQVAPGGRVVVVAALTAGDQLRRVERVAQRTAQLRRRDRWFGDDARAIWQGGEAWQPLRSCLERLLATFDWGEVFAGTCLCLAPLLDDLALGVVAAEARARGDERLGEIFASLEDDGRWHRDWARTLVRTAVEQEPANRQVIAGWVARWLPPAAGAVVALGRGALEVTSPAGPALAEGAEAFFETLGLMSGEKFRERQLSDSRHASIPVVVVSAANDGHERARGMGVAAYLRKPLHLAHLIETVNAHR